MVTRMVVIKLLISVIPVLLLAPDLGFAVDTSGIIRHYSVTIKVQMYYSVMQIHIQVYVCTYIHCVIYDMCMYLQYVYRYYMCVIKRIDNL